MHFLVLFSILRTTEQWLKCRVFNIVRRVKYSAWNSLVSILIIGSSDCRCTIFVCLVVLRVAYITRNWMWFSMAFSTFYTIIKPNVARRRSEFLIFLKENCKNTFRNCFRNTSKIQWHNCYNISHQRYLKSDRQTNRPIPWSSAIFDK